MAVTATIPGSAVAERIESAFPGTVLASDATSVTVPSDRIVEVAQFVRDDAELDAKYLNCLTAVDWIEYFDIVYCVSSLSKNHTFNLKARCTDHEQAIVPSVNVVWMGANLQEREVFDLMGIVFEGHPAMRRIFLWEGFPGHPLRKDFLALPGGFKPGLQRFPYEFPAGQRAYPALANTDSPTAPAVPRLDQPPAPALPVGQDPQAAERTSQRVADEEAGEAGEEHQGAGSDVTQAGGTAAEPGEAPSEEAKS